MKGTKKWERDVVAVSGMSGEAVTGWVEGMEL